MGTSGSRFAGRHGACPGRSRARRPPERWHTSRGPWALVGIASAPDPAWPGLVTLDSAAPAVAEAQPPIPPSKDALSAVRRLGDVLREEYAGDGESIEVHPKG